MKKLKKDKIDKNQPVKKDTEVVKLIRKANRLVEGKYRFDIWEMRVFTKMLMKIHRDDEDFKVYRIYLHEVIQDFELQEDGHSYKFLKQGAERLGRREIRVLMDTPDGKMELFTHIATGVKSFVEEKTAKYLDISFHPDMKPYLLQLQSQFLMYDVRNILKLQSSFSIRIYELLKQYETIGKRTLKVQELKEMLDVIDKYPLYGNFKQRVIVKAQEDLEKYTDIKFTFDEVKSGRAVTGLVFWIIPNREKQDSGNLLYLPEVAATLVEDNDLEISQLLTLSQRWAGVSKNVVEQWKNTYGFERVLAQIKKTNKQISEGKKIHNPMGFVVWSLQNPEITTIVSEPVLKTEPSQNQAPPFSAKQIAFYLNGEFANWFVIYLQNVAINCDKILYHQKVDELRATYSEKLFNSLFMFSDGSVNEESLNSSVGIKLIEMQHKTKETIFQEWFWNKFNLRIIQQRSGDWEVI